MNDRKIQKQLRRYKQLNRRFNENAALGREPRLNMVREWKKLHQLLNSVLAAANGEQPNA